MSIFSGIAVFGKIFEDIRDLKDDRRLEPALAQVENLCHQIFALLY
jgi:hypothetical protein